MVGHREATLRAILLGTCWGHVGGHLGACLAHVEVCGRDVGAKLGPCWAMLTACRSDVEAMSG